MIKCRKTLINLLMDLSMQKTAQLCGCNELLGIQDADEEQNYRILTKFFQKNKPLWKKELVTSGNNDSKKDLEDKLLKLKSDTRPAALSGVDKTGKQESKCKEYVKLLQYITDEIHTNGGLQKYQLASIMGQDTKRGGDSSKFLIKWLNELNDEKKGLVDCENQLLYHNMRALEIGCLNANNYISRSPKLISSVERIDLNSNDTGLIKKQDFMERPLPGFIKKGANIRDGKILAKDKESQVFDLISCSMVLNFVPVDTKRGEMLKRIKLFLKDASTNISTGLPGGLLFLVLPLPCINNSRYMNDEFFVNSIMLKALNFRLLKRHHSHKIIYYLFEETDKKTNDIFIKRNLTKRSLTTSKASRYNITPSTSPGTLLEPKNDKNKNNFCILF